MKKPYVGLDRTSFKLIVLKESTVVDEKNRRVIHIVNWKLDIPSILYMLGCATRTEYHWNEFISGIAKGIAVCHEEDIFNPEVGKKMARAIAESNAYTNASKRMQKFMSHLFLVANQLNEQELDFRIKSNEVIVHNKEYMDGLLNK